MTDFNTKPKRKVMLISIDGKEIGSRSSNLAGWGIAPKGPGNAITNAKTPVMSQFPDSKDSKVFLSPFVRGVIVIFAATSRATGGVWLRSRSAQGLDGQLRSRTLDNGRRTRAVSGLGAHQRGRLSFLTHFHSILA